MVEKMADEMQTTKTADFSTKSAEEPWEPRTMLRGMAAAAGESSTTGRREDTAGEDGDGWRRRPGWLRRWEVVTAADEDEEDGCGWNRGGR